MSSPKGARHEAGIFPRDTLKPGNRVAGPALIMEPHQTIVVEPGWAAEVTAKDHVVLRRVVPRDTRTPSARTPTR